MKKTLIILVTIILITLLTTGFVFASDTGYFEGFRIVNTIVNDAEVVGDVPAVILYDRTMVPLRFIGEALGAKIEWDQSTYTAIVTQKENTSSALPKLTSSPNNFGGFRIVNVLVNGEKVIGDVPAVLLNGRTMVPLRFVAEALGAEIEWDSSSYTVMVKQDGYLVPVGKPSLDRALVVNKSYLAKDGLNVLLKSMILTENVGSYKLQISYTLKNNTSDQKIDESTFKIHFDDGTYENQYGFFGSLFPSQNIDRTYTFEYLKTKKAIAIEYGSDFFDKGIISDSLIWVID